MILTEDELKMLHYAVVKCNEGGNDGADVFEAEELCEHLAESHNTTREVIWKEYCHCYNIK